VATRRYRCAACGNLTRFDVTTTRTARAFHHYTVGGELVVEDEQVLAHSVDEVVCRWCGHGRSVEEVTDGTAAPLEAVSAGDRGSSDGRSAEQSPDGVAIP
jgi:hypothetical protein